jgi:CRP/FNR family transcriptional regulator, cyclic AMP receptor protein
MDSATHHQSCFKCELRPDRIFCDLPADALLDFDAIKAVTRVPRGETLFHEGRVPRGVFVICEGRVKLSVCSENGKRLMLRVAGPGEVLGLSATMSGKGYELTAEAMDMVQVAFIKRRDLLKFLRDHREACLQVVHLLSQDLHTAFDRVRTVGLTRTRRVRMSIRAHA